MNNEDALLQIQSIPEKIWNQLSPSDKDAMEMAFNALEKQIPKKFKMKDDYTPICPVCGEAVWDMEWCNSRGQRLDVDEED